VVVDPYQLAFGISLVIIAWAFPDHMAARRSGEWRSPPTRVGRLLRWGGGPIGLIPLLTQIWGWIAIASAIVVWLWPGMSSKAGAATFLVVDGVGLLCVATATLLTWINDRLAR
jgi:hypothetical protein